MELELLDHICSAAPPPSASGFVALATADPTDAAASRQVIQRSAVTFPHAGGTWGSIMHWTIFVEEEG